MGDKFKISELKSEVLRNLSLAVDSVGNNDSKINDAEFEKLQTLLTGAKNIDKEFENESDSIKNLFGYKSTATSPKDDA